MYSRSKPTSCEQFLEYLDKLPWCKQADSKLVAVHHCSSEVVEVLRAHDHDLKVYPGGVPIKINKSTLSMLEEKDKAGESVPLLLVWAATGVEMSFRTHKSAEFPYDMWQNPAAAAYERESVFVEAKELGSQASECFNKHIAGAKACPSTIPSL
jgi:hypothetical protein